MSLSVLPPPLHHFTSSSQSVSLNIKGNHSPTQSLDDIEGPGQLVRFESAIMSIKHDHHHTHHHHHHNHSGRSISHPVANNQSNNQLIRRSFWNLKCSCLFSTLPDEVLLFDVFTYLEPTNLSTLQSVCTRWKWLSGDRSLWSKLDLSPLASKLTDSALLSIFNRFGSGIQVLKLCNCNKLSADFFQSEQTIAAFSSLTKLKQIHFCNVRHVSDSAVSAVARAAPHLEHVSLYGCVQLTDVAVQSLSSNCRRINELSVRGCHRLTDAAFDVIPSSLQGLNVAGCKHLTSKTVLSIAESCPSLQRLNLHGTVLTDAGINALTSRCLQLQSLHLSSANPFGGNPALTESSMSGLNCLADLSVLNLQGSANLNDDALNKLLSPFNLTHLQRLNLGGCYRITNSGLSLITDSPFKLTHLSIFQCFHINDDALLALLTKQDELQHLDVHSCVAVTDALLQFLSNPNNAPKLQSLDIGSCRLITVDQVAALRAARPELQLVHY